MVKEQSFWKKYWWIILSIIIIMLIICFFINKFLVFGYYPEHSLMCRLHTDLCN